MDSSEGWWTTSRSNNSTGHCSSQSTQPVPSNTSTGHNRWRRTRSARSSARASSETGKACNSLAGAPIWRHILHPALRSSSSSAGGLGWGEEQGIVVVVVVVIYNDNDFGIGRRIHLGRGISGRVSADSFTRLVNGVRIVFCFCELFMEWRRRRCGKTIFQILLNRRYNEIISQMVPRDTQKTLLQIFHNHKWDRWDYRPFERSNFIVMLRDKLLFFHHKCNDGVWYAIHSFSKMFFSSIS